MTATTARLNRDMLRTVTEDDERQRRALAKFGHGFLTQVATRGTAPRAPQCAWELDRRHHETHREQLLSPAYRNPIAACDIREGDVISEGSTMRALVRQAHTTLSGRVILGVSWLSIPTGVPADEVQQLPVLAGTDRSLHLVTRDLSEVAPYAVPLPEVTR